MQRRKERGKKEVIRINITLENEYFKRLKTINKEENKGLLKEGTFAKKIVMDYIDSKLKKDYIRIDGITLKQEDLFTQQKRQLKEKVIKRLKK